MPSQNDKIQTMPSNFSFEDASIKDLIHANGIYNRYEVDWFNKFTRIPIKDPYNTLTGTKEYLFFTKPDLPILDFDGNNINPILGGNSFFADCVKRYNMSARQLQTYLSGNSSPFIPMLSNAVTSTLDLPGLQSSDIDTAANTMGTNITYRGSSIKSDEDVDFSLEFEDTKYLDIYMFFKMYDEYEKLKWDGALNYSASPHWSKYIKDKVLHDQFSIYKIVVADDGYRIVYWARITGVFPNSIPRDAFSDMRDTTTQKLTVGFKGHFVRDMDPVILAHFNMIQDNVSSYGEIPIWNTNTHTFNTTLAKYPRVVAKNVGHSVAASRGNHVEYFLRWLG